MTHALKSGDIATDELSRHLLSLCRYTTRVTRSYNTHGQPTIHLDNDTAPHRLGWWLSTLSAWGLVDWTPGTTTFDVARLTPLGVIFHDRWETQLFHGDAE